MALFSHVFLREQVPLASEDTEGATESADASLSGVASSALTSQC